MKGILSSRKTTLELPNMWTCSFTLTKHDARATPMIVIGIMTFFGKPTQVLIHLGSTHSFISFTYAVNANVPWEFLGYSLLIVRPTAEDIIVDGIYHNYALRVRDKEMLICLIPLSIYDFDVILGMDKLVSHHASIECFKKEMIFKIPDENEFRSSNDHQKVSFTFFPYLRQQSYLEKDVGGF